MKLQSQKRSTFQFFHALKVCSVCSPCITRTLRSIPFAHIVYRAFKKHSPCTHCLFSVHLSFSPSSFIFIRKLQSTFHVKNIIFIRIFLVEFKEPVHILEQVCTSRYTKKTCFCFCFFVLQYYRCMFFLTV